ncbi:YkgJ family cysteine cluster protein [Perlucidibaca piscinae]|uniref:YkgJ family cysteine cluster protein n=1 Tax=Perlucidibaca piscinae TaxID=392589 RepID=UPI0003B5BCE6|nr:YkgJ family cysteine cluster protein [Perlucidibaca piscinae]
MTRIPTRAADLDRLETWVRYRNGLCGDCRATCCTMPVEVRLDDLVRLGVVDEFERGEPIRLIARRLEKARIVDHFNHKQEVFTLARRASGDCLYLHAQTRRCTVYERRPTTCRQHPQIAPRPGHCAWQPLPA